MSDHAAPGAASAAVPAATARPRDARKLLVAYASRYGSTAEVAEAIARVLRAQDLTVDVSPALRIARVDDYDAVVVGSAVRFGAWIDEAVDFLRRCRAGLTTRPVAFFTMHMQRIGSGASGSAQISAYARAARALVTPRVEAHFLGALLPSRLSFVDKMAVRMVGAPLQDLRDWQAIEAWAQSLPAALFAPARPAP